MRTVNKRMTAKREAEVPEPDEAKPVKRIGVTATQIAAAKLQVAIDRRFGRETPEILKKIAALRPDLR